MRHWIWITSLALAAACSGKSNAVQSADTSNPGGAGIGAVAGSGGSSGVAHDAGASGASAIGTGGQGRNTTGATAGRGAAGTIATAGSGGASERDAGQGAAGRAGGGGRQGAAGERAGTGGNAGAGGSADESCDQLQTDYDMARPDAQMCDARASGQCQQVVAARLGCYCMIHVNDASTLNDIQARYTRAGCPTATCPGVACINPSGTCTMIDSGDVCQ